MEQRPRLGAHGGRVRRGHLAGRVARGRRGGARPLRRLRARGTAAGDDVHARAPRGVSPSRHQRDQPVLQRPALQRVQHVHRSPPPRAAAQPAAARAPRGAGGDGAAPGRESRGRRRSPLAARVAEAPAPSSALDARTARPAAAGRLRCRRRVLGRLRVAGRERPSRRGGWPREADRQRGRASRSCVSPRRAGTCGTTSRSRRSSSARIRRTGASTGTRAGPRSGPTRPCGRASSDRGSRSCTRCACWRRAPAADARGAALARGFEARLLALSTTYFGLASPLVNVDRLATGAGLVASAVDDASRALALARERVDRRDSACRPTGGNRLRRTRFPARRPDRRGRLPSAAVTIARHGPARGGRAARGRALGGMPAPARGRYDAALRGPRIVRRVVRGVQPLRAPLYRREWRRRAARIHAAAGTGGSDARLRRRPRRLAAIRTRRHDAVR